MATLTVTTSTDFRGGAAETNIDEIVFAAGAAATATFGSDQFGAGLISHNVEITGDSFDNTVVVHVSGSFPANGLALTNWSASDVILFLGTSGKETITISTAGSIVQSGGGGDILFGLQGNDTFRYLGGEVVGATSIEDFGSGDVDTVQIGDNAGNLDFTSASIKGVERLGFTSGAATVSLDSSAFGLGMTSVVGGTGADSLIVKIRQGASSANLSSVAFTSWSNGIDTITINGTDAGDTIRGSTENDTINGGDGADTLLSSGGVDTLNGGDGDDTFELSAQDLLPGVILNGGSGTDTIELQSTNTFDITFATLTSIERLVFTAAAIATLAHENVGSGNITSIVGSSGADTLRIDTDFTTNPVTADLSAVSFLNWSGNDAISIRGQSGNDTLTGSDQNDEILGRDGNDIITGGLGADTLHGDAGDDVFRYAAASEFAAGEVIFGDAGTDTVQIENGSYDFSTSFDVEVLQFANTPQLAGAPQTTAIFQGGTASFVVGSAGANGLTVNAVDLVAQGFASLQAVSFTSWTVGQDTITINGLAGTDNILVGSSQDDTINGANLNDIMTGGAGNDIITGGLGDDTFNGGAGDDTAAFSGNRSSYTLQVAGNTIVVSGLDGTDTLSSIERLQFADGAVDLADLADDGSALFDTLFYLSQNPDVFHAGVNALGHFNTFGFHEGRDPNAWFDTSGYLAVNKDVAAAGINPLDHYHYSGWQEGRDPSANFDTALYLINNPDVAAAGIDPLEHFLQFGLSEGRSAFAAIGQKIVGGFDAEFYLFHNPDVAAAGVDPFFHYDVAGRFEGRNPNAWFDTAGYLAHYADVAAAGINPLFHYQVVGWTEGRDPSAGFDTLGYLAANPDVAAAGINPLDHFLQFGIYEGRVAINDGLFH